MAWRHKGEGPDAAQGHAAEGFVDLRHLRHRPDPSARHAAGRNPPDPQEHHPGTGYAPRHEEPQDHRHRIEPSLAGGGVLAALRRGGVQVVAWRLLPTVVLAVPGKRLAPALHRQTRPAWPLSRRSGGVNEPDSLAS